MKKSEHFDGRRFHNLEIKNDLKSTWDLIRWKWSSKAKQWPLDVPNQVYPFPRREENQKAIVTFINHATFLLQFFGLNILTDPLYSERASPFRFIGPKRARRPGLAFESLPTIDVVIISHNHYDHLDLETLKLLDAKFHPIFIVPLGDKSLLEGEGLLNVVELDWWKEFRVKDTRFIFNPSQHWSARGLFDKNQSLWGSYFIDNGAFKIYFAGDTGYASHFLQIKNRYGAPDLALLPIGGYEPQWFMKEHHMNPEEAVKAHLDLGSSFSIGMHFGTFQLTDEGIDDPINEMVKAREKNKVSPEDFITLDQGESKILN